MRPTRSQLLEVVETLIEEAVEEEALGGIAAEVWQALEGTDDDSPSQYEMWSLIEAHDRVSLGLESALACRLSVPPARAWWLGGGRQLALASEAVDSLIGGCRLSLESLTALLQRHQVTTGAFTFHG